MVDTRWHARCTADGCRYRRVGINGEPVYNGGKAHERAEGHEVVFFTTPFDEPPPSE